MCHVTHEEEDSLQELVLSSLHGGHRDQIQVVRLSKHLHPRSLSLMIILRFLETGVHWF